jgi:L-seryl-tRNA(Ser) seleniumtransferase
MGTEATLRNLPAVDRLLDDPCWADAPQLPTHLRRDACRVVVASLREAILAGEHSELPPIPSLAAEALQHALAETQPALRRVVNATGVVLHTNLGRAPLCEAALAAIAELAGGYTNLEMDLDSGRRDSRNMRLVPSLARVLGAPDVAVVNNNAAAVYLSLCALAGDGVGVAVSRGELVEIGGSFRMPDIMASSGARLMEVGTTNRTRLADYERALDEGARVLLKVHQSNFAIVGFTEEVEIQALVALAHERGAIVIHDLGSGLLNSTPQLGKACVAESRAAGVDLVLFSGDKLLGGPQAGVIAGRSELLERIRRHPMARMLRPGKLTFLALEATLLAWERDSGGSEVLASRLCNRSAEELEAEANRLAADLSAAAPPGTLVTEVVAVQSTPGGGSSALLQLPSSAVALSSPRCSEDQLAALLRRGEPAVLGRIEDGRVLLDVRTLLSGDHERILAALTRLN